MKKKIFSLALAALFALSLFGCSSDDEEGSVVGTWRAPAGSGQSEGFIYQLSEDGQITSSFGGVLYSGGTYEVKGGKITLKNYPVARTSSAGDYSYTVVDYSNETEVSFELSDNELTLTGPTETILWTRAASVIPTPVPTPTPAPTPDPTPTPPPELESVRVLYGGEPLPFKDEFSLQVGEHNKLDKFTIELIPPEAEAEVTIVSENEEVFIVELIEVLPNNAFSVTGVGRGNAQLTVTAGDEVQKITVRVTEPD